MGVTVLDIHKALEARHPADAWVYLRELRTRTGYEYGPNFSTFDQIRSIDAFAMGCWKSNGHRRVAYEIKVSRGDWLRELKDQHKRTQAYFLAHEFWFALAPGVINATPGVGNDFLQFQEALHGCGVLEVQEDGTVKVIERAKRHEAWPMPEAFIASLLRNAAARYATERKEAEQAIIKQYGMDSLFDESA